MSNPPLDRATKGPWRARQREWGYADYEGGPERRLWEIQDANGTNIAGCTIYSKDKADACLMAAAPELLEACENVEAVLSIVEPRSHKAEYLKALEIIRGAIAKAKGL